jgi:DNA-binding transcriptional ArsR family regulator
MVIDITIDNGITSDINHARLEDVSAATAEILLHPVRLRIVLALGAQQMTTSQLAERLPDVAHATLYRQVATLAEAGLLAVVDERRIRGGVERTYALVTEAAQLGPADAAAMSPGELLRGFVLFAGALIEAFARYTEHAGARPVDDGVSFRQAALWLNAQERAELSTRLRTTLGPYLENRPTAERQRLLLSTVLVPDLAATAGDRAAPGREAEEGSSANE